MKLLTDSRATLQLLVASCACWIGAAIALALRQADAEPLALIALLSLWKATRQSRRQQGWLCIAIACSVAAWSCHVSTSGHSESAIDNPVRARLLSAQSERAQTRLTLLRPDGERCTVAVPTTSVDRLDRPPAGAVPGAFLEVPLRPDELERGRLEAVSSSAIDVVEAPRGAWFLFHAIQSLRHRFAQRAERRLCGQASGNRDAGALLLALVAGIDRFITVADWEDLRASGLAHVAVASGAQVAIVATAATLLLVPWFGRHHPLRRNVMLFSVAAACVFLLPFEPPILRAGLALGWMVLSRVCGRGVSALGALAFAVLALLCHEPSLGSSLSFSLTVGATLALIVAGSTTNRMRWLALLLAPMSVTQPLIVAVFGRIAPWGVIANLAIVPATVTAVVGGWLVLLWPQQLWGLHALRTLSEFSAWWILAVSREIACWPWSGRLVAPTSTLWLIGSLGTAAAWWLGSRRWCALGFSGWLALAVWPCVSLTSGKTPSLDVIDVGQGQSVLLSDSRYSMLIDAGPGSWRGASRNLMERLRDRGVQRLTRLVVTHADSDHIGGMRDLLAATPPLSLAIPEGAIDSPRLRALIAAAASRGIPLQPIATGDVWRDGVFGAEVLYPPPGQRGDSNDSSAVLRITVGSFEALTMGDAGEAVEQELQRRAQLESVPVLIVGHHGSRSATSSEFLRTVSARVAAISCGAGNRFGHPHQQTLANLRQMQVRTFVTARHGTISFLVANHRLQIRLISSRVRKHDWVWHEAGHQDQGRKRGKHDARPPELVRLIE